jgi:hypothetical protein
VEPVYNETQQARPEFACEVGAVAAAMAGNVLGLVDHQHRGGAWRQQFAQHGEPPGPLAHVDVAVELCHCDACGRRAIAPQDVIQIRLLRCLTAETGRGHRDHGIR